MGGTLVIEGVSYIDISDKISSFEKAVLSIARSILSRFNAMKGLLKNYLANLSLIVEKKVETPVFIDPCSSCHRRILPLRSI